MLLQLPHTHQTNKRAVFNGFFSHEFPHILHTHGCLFSFYFHLVLFPLSECLPELDWCVLLTANTLLTFSVYGDNFSLHCTGGCSSGAPIALQVRHSYFNFKSNQSEILFEALFNQNLMPNENSAHLDQ